MSNIQRPNNNNSKGTPKLLPILLLGIGIGASLMWLLALRNGEGAAETSASLRTTPEEDNGWHSIHVYYGEKSGLKTKPGQEWFAQVHQVSTIQQCFARKICTTVHIFLSKLCA